MQCPRCGLHNMPGAAVCIQCRNDLAAPEGSAPADFYPPRGDERGLRKGLERKQKLKRLEDVSDGSRFDDFIAPVYIYGRHLRRGFLSVLPGLAQQRNHEPKKAAAFALAALASIVTVFFAIRLPISNGLMFSFLTVQIMAVLDGTLVSLRNTTKEPVGIVTAAGLGFLVSSVFFGAWMLVVGAGGEFFLRARVPGSVGPFVDGDRVLCLNNRWSRTSLAPGNWLLAYRQFGERVYDQTPLGGESLELVLATPGRRVSLQGGRLLVNGELQRLLPKLPAARPGDDLSNPNRSVPAGAVLTLQHRWVNGVLHRSVGFTKDGEIRGRILAVTNPPTHRSLVTRERQ